MTPQGGCWPVEKTSSSHLAVYDRTPSAEHLTWALACVDIHAETLRSGEEKGVRSSGTQKRRSCSVLTLTLLHHRQPRTGHGATSPRSRPDWGWWGEAARREKQGRLRPRGGCGHQKAELVVSEVTLSAFSQVMGLSWDHRLHRFTEGETRPQSKVFTHF